MKSQKTETPGPRILLIDIETAPDVTYNWTVYQSNAIAIHEHWYVLSYGARWRGEEKIVCHGLDDFEGYTHGPGKEKKLLREVWELFDQADIVVAHNGAPFDVRKLNARFIAHGFPPPTPFKVVDTKRDLKGVAAFSSNRLNWLCKQLGIGQKTMEHHDWAMWQGCMNGDRDCWKEMKVYNAHDIVLLSELYERVAAWIPQPNAQLWDPNRPERCVNPACSNPKMHRHSTYAAQGRTYDRYRCPKCGAIARSRKSVRGVTLVPTPRRYA